jgi:DNA polymerase-3 subunit epsilon
MKLIGLDFETANGKSGSICSVGLACVEAGGVAETRHWLVKPHTSMTWMSPFCTEVHGLPAIQFPYVCSLRTSRKVLTSLASHKLDAVANHLGFTFKHHDALEDAIACAKIIAHVGVPEGAHNMFLFPNVNA